MTNGVVEAKNNVAKTLIKISYGMNSFKNLRSKIIQGEKLRKENQDNKRKQQYNNIIKKLR